ncbi:MAG: tetratricopeptide repeat protein [Acidobacteria bacterium]|nr:tetratricopeptide repeat protein [Acidobacteriota bacterium]
MTGAWSRFRAFVERMEELPIGPGALAATLAAIIAVRNLLELVVAKNPVFHGLSAFVHYPMAYVAPFFALTLVLALWSGVASARVARLMLMAWLLTLLPPVADLVLHRTHDAPTIGYLHADPSELGWIWLHFFDPTASFVGTTPGIRLEILAAVLLAFVYILLRGRSWWRAVLGAATVYVVSLFFLSLMVLVHGLFRFGNPSLSRTDLLWGEALLKRMDRDTSPDSVALMWLGLTMAGLGAVWWLSERRPLEPRWLRGRGGASAAPGLVPLLLAAMAAGILVAFFLHLPVGQAMMVAPYDALALPAALLALALLASALLRPDAGGARRGAMLLVGGAITAGLGRSVAVPLLAAVLPLVVLTADWVPRWMRRGASIAVGAVSVLSAVAAGYALVVGREALARVPGDLLVLGLFTGAAAGALMGGGSPAPAWLRALLTGVALGLGGLLLAGPVLGGVGLVAGAAVGALAGWAESGLEPKRRGVWTGALAGIALLVVARGAVAVPATTEPLKAEARCVARLHVIRAQEYEEKKEWLNAKPQYLEALKCDENSVDALRGLALGLLANEEGKIERAVELLEKAAKLAPYSAVELSNLASAYLQAGRASDALPLLDTAVRLDPRDPSALFNRARALEDLGRRTEAIAAWEAFVARAAPLPDSAADVRQARQSLRALREGTAPR